MEFFAYFALLVAVALFWWVYRGIRLIEHQVRKELAADAARSENEQEPCPDDKEPSP